MQIPPQKKLAFWLIVAAALIVGIVVGVFFVSYVFYKFKEPLCSKASLDTKKAAESTMDKFVEKVSLLQPGTTLAGKVLSKESSEFSVETVIASPLDTRVSTTTVIRVPFDGGRDTVLLFKSPGSQSQSAPTQPVQGTLGDIKTGQQLLVKVLQDGKKTVYILPVQ